MSLSQWQEIIHSKGASATRVVPGEEGGPAPKEGREIIPCGSKVFILLAPLGEGERSTYVWIDSVLAVPEILPGRFQKKLQNKSGNSSAKRRGKQLPT